MEEKSPVGCETDRGGDTEAPEPDRLPSDDASAFCESKRDESISSDMPLSSGTVESLDMGGGRSCRGMKIQV